MIVFRQLRVYISFFIMSFIIFGCEEQSTKVNNPVKKVSFTSCEKIKTENLKIAKLNELVKKAEAGDKRLMYMLSSRLINENISRPYTYWDKKMADAGEISSRYMFIHIADEKDKSKLIKQWYFEDYEKAEKYILDPEWLPMPQEMLNKITNKANHNNLVAMYILQEYYLPIDKKKYIFWREKLANSDQIVSQSSLLFDSNSTKRLEIAKKYHLELDYFMSRHLELLNKGIVEYRDDDPKGVFFDENGSVINFE